MSTGWGCDRAEPVYTSRSEQAPGSEFHPREKSGKKMNLVFWDLLGAIKM